VLYYRKLLQEKEFLLVSDEKMRGEHFVCSKRCSNLSTLCENADVEENILLNDTLYRVPAKNYCIYYIILIIMSPSSDFMHSYCNNTHYDN